MYTGLELALIAYVLGFVIHIAYFRAFEGFYKFIININAIKPTGWCFVWPIAWLLFGIFYGALLGYCVIEYVISEQWNFRW